MSPRKLLPAAPDMGRFSLKFRTPDGAHMSVVGPMHDKALYALYMFVCHHDREEDTRTLYTDACEQFMHTVDVLRRVLELDSLHPEPANASLERAEASPATSEAPAR